MISVYYYIKAKKRLKFYEESVTMFGGESDCPTMTLYNRDIAKHEVQYYSEKFPVKILRSLRIL